MIRALTFTLALLLASPVSLFVRDVAAQDVAAQDVAAQDVAAQEAPAQDAPAQREDPGASRSATFEAAQGAQTEEIPGGALMIAAYGIIWLLLLGFVASLGFRHAQTQRELARLREDLNAHARQASSGGPSPEDP